MIYEKIRFDENDKDALLEVYAPNKVGDFVRSAMLVIPGGGYQGLSLDTEGEPIAQAFLPYGYSAFVLHYSVKKKPFPSHLIQASKAIKYIKDNSEKYNINPDRVFVAGFSAGGHLAASLGTLWDMEEIYNEVEMPFGYNKPRGMILGYPVISAKYHEISFENLLMDKKDSEEMLYKTSLENAVSERTIPAFILHTSNDSVVDVKNPIVFAGALAENNIEFEMHIYPDAPHGVALGNEITACGKEKKNNPQIAKWIEYAAKWAENI